MKVFYTFYKYMFLFLIGGFSYYFIEIAFRGYSHFSMFICGGLAFVLSGALNQWSHFEMSLISQMFLSMVIITGLELVTGLIVNVWLQLNVWDYSAMPYQFMGQICLLYSVLWMALSLVCIFVDDLLRWKIFKEEKPRYKIL